MFYRDLSKFSGVLFRLDSDEGVVGLSTHLTNLSRLMENCQDRYVQENAILCCNGKTNVSLVNVNFSLVYLSRHTGC